MKSNICKIENGTKDLEAILVESEKVASYMGLNHKQTLQLRLICEEVDGMLPNLIEDFDGEFWIEFDNNECKVNVLITIAELTSNKKSELIQVATNKKNAAARGIVGKIRSAIENFFLNENRYQNYDMPLGGYNLASEFGSGTSVNYSYLWGLNQYKTTVKPEQAEEWDELEKSIIASLADEIVVGVKGKQASIVITKKFA